MTLVSAHPFPAKDAQKRLVALRFWLLGRGYHKALRALEYNRKLFPGTRKDGITPEFDHHVCQAQYLRTLPGLLFPEQALATIFFHDTPEDRGIAFDEIQALYADDPGFGKSVAQAARKVTKSWRGQKFDEAGLFEAMATCPIASVVKGGDRIHNLQSMVEVFSLDKQRSYLDETQRLVLPMLKSAERNFPEQEPAYKNIRTVLKMQVNLIDAGLIAQGA